MAGSSVSFSGKDRQGLREVSIAWTSDDTTGAASGTSSLSYTGRLVGVTFISGAATPTTGYAVTLTDVHGRDVLGGAGASVASASTTYVQAVSSGIPLPSFVDTTLTFAVANAGNSKNGTVVLHYV